MVFERKLMSVSLTQYQTDGRPELKKPQRRGWKGGRELQERERVEDVYKANDRARLKELAEKYRK